MLNSISEWNAIGLSLWIATVSVAISLPFGLWLGLVMSRSRFPGKLIVETVVNLPLVLPPVVTGYLLLVSFGKNGWIGAWLVRALGIEIVFDWKGAALASAIVSFPLMVRAIRIAFDAVDRKQEVAARTLGASPWDVFLSISLPLARKGVVAGCILAFARSLGEFGATIMVAGNIAGETQTIPLFIYEKLQTPGGMYQATGVVLFSILLAAIAIYLSSRFESRASNRLEARSP
ncbi:MAG: molybdate ABC transporter permease subunit [Pirellulaceae bacterium]